jgi:hypothetical protein
MIWVSNCISAPTFPSVRMRGGFVTPKLSAPILARSPFRPRPFYTALAVATIEATSGRAGEHARQLLVPSHR